MKQWFSDMQKEVHVLGPLLPSGYGIETQNSEERSSVAIEAFLGGMQVQHGKRSVFFASLTFPFFRVRATTTQSLFRFPLALSSGPLFRNILTS